MPDFLLELLSEEIPARMQPRARDDLARLFEAEIAKAGLKAERIETFSTPRRLALIARNLPEQTEAVRDELKGPRTSAPPQALDGFLRKTGLTQDQLTTRDGVYYAIIDKPGRATASVLAEAIPAIVRAFPWPKSMRWGAASQSTESLRWVRPLHGIVALLGGEIVPFEIDGIASGAETVGHRFHHPGRITIGSADDYAAKLRACHVLVDHEEREAIIATGATAVAAQAGLTLVRDEALLRENAGLTEWPVPLLGSFDPSFLEVPPEVIQLTMATNQKYFAVLQSSPSQGEGEGDHAKHGGGARTPALSRGEGSSSPFGLSPSTAFGGPPPQAELGEERKLAPAFICTANIEPRDGGAAIVDGNRKVLAARLSDAKFFWEQDLKVPLEEQAKKLDQIVFHEKLGTVADKVERVAKLARWLVDEGIVGGGDSSDPAKAGAVDPAAPNDATLRPSPEHMASLAETAARFCKADLVTGMVGEFPELQGVMGGYYARAQGHPDAVADAIRDHYKPVGQGDEVPTAPVTIAVSLADKLDTLVGFFAIYERPTGSRDPFALRRAALGIIDIIVNNGLRCHIRKLFSKAYLLLLEQVVVSKTVVNWDVEDDEHHTLLTQSNSQRFLGRIAVLRERPADWLPEGDEVIFPADQGMKAYMAYVLDGYVETVSTVTEFVFDRVEDRQRRLGLRHDLIRSAIVKTYLTFRPISLLGREITIPSSRVHNWETEDDLVRLLARVRALQAFVERQEGADLLAGYKRAANILKKEGWGSPSPAGAGEGQASVARQGEGSPSPSQSPDGDRAPPSPGTGEGLIQGIPQTGEEDPFVMAEDLRDAIVGHEKLLSYTPAPEEQSLIAALDSAEPRARAAIEAENFEGAMGALATLRGPVDAFFEKVTVNDPDPAKRAARLNLLARMRDAVHQVADFSRIEG